MWAHYGEKQSGICLEFVLRKHAEPIIYLDEPRIRLINAMAVSDHRSQGKTIDAFLRKSGLDYQGAYADRVHTPNASRGGQRRPFLTSVQPQTLFATLIGPTGLRYTWRAECRRIGSAAD